MNAIELHKFKRQIILIVLGCTLPFVLTAIGFLVDDHYQMKSIKDTIDNDLVTKAMFQSEIYRWEQLQERKIHNLEIIALRDSQLAREDALEAKEELKELRRQINDHIERANRVRGIPEDAIIKK